MSKYDVPVEQYEAGEDRLCVDCGRPLTAAEFAISDVHTQCLYDSLKAPTSSEDK